MSTTASKGSIPPDRRLEKIRTATTGVCLGAAALGVAFAHIAACGSAPIVPSSAESFDAAVAALRISGDAAVLVGAGDIVRCDRPGPARATSRIVSAVIDAAPHAVVFTTGDHVYPDATAEALAACYEPVWGRFNARTRPVPGNHDYEASGGEPYYRYFHVFERFAGARPRGYYQFELGAWRVFALNSLLTVEPDAVQVRWLEDALRAAPETCILAYWHHPLFSSGYHGYLPWDAGRDTDVFWERLARHGADLIVNGHEHLYERFHPQDAAGRPSAGGLRQFTAGTGGGRLHPIIFRRANSAYLSNRTFGVLVLVLRESSYEWAFIGIDGLIHDRSDAPAPC